MIRKTLRSKVKDARDSGKRTSISQITDSIFDYYTSKNSLDTCLWISLGALSGLIIGLAVSFLVGNPYLGPGLGFLGFIFPLLIINTLIGKEQQKKREHLDSAAFLITTLYMKDSELLKAVRESENCFQKDIQPLFSVFLAEAEGGTGGVEGALASLFRKMPTPELKEWCSQLLLCQEDKSKIESLPLLLDSISERKLLDEDAALHIADKKKEFYLLLMIIALSVPILSKINPSLVQTVTNSLFGQILLGLFALVLILSFWKVYCIGNNYSR